MRFRDIEGQEEIKRKLIRTVADQRVSHAQLFFGPEGNEKLALAVAYAQYINCKGTLPPAPSLGREGGQDYLLGDSCGVCPSCVKFEKLIHPDLHFIYPVATTKRVTKKPKSVDFIAEWRTFLAETNYRGNIHDWFAAIGIENKQGIINADDCHEIINTLSYTSYESEYKVMIIWMAEKLYHAAAPKILKILEEPPEKTLFILITEDPDQILATIKSRTLPVRIPQSKGVRRDREDPENFAIFSNWMRLCFRADMAKLVALSAELARIGRENQKSLFNYSLGIIQQCLAFGFGNDDLVNRVPEEKEFTKKIAPYINPSNIGQFNKLFQDAIYHIERNAYPQVLFLDVSLQITRLFSAEAKKKNR
jgi:DNA polymerase III subunit delta'